MTINKKVLMLLIASIFLVGLMTVPNIRTHRYTTVSIDSDSWENHTSQYALSYHKTAISGTAPPSSGDWNISDITVVENEKVIVNGSIYVEDGGTLILKNSMIYLNPSGFERSGIVVCSNGNLTILNTKITSYNEKAFYMLAESGSYFYMDNVTVSNLGVMNQPLALGVMVNTENATIINSRIYEGIYGLYIFSASNVEIRNNTIYSASKGIAVELSDNVTISNNTIYSHEFVGIHVESSTNVFIYGNTVRDCKSVGIEIDKSSYVNIYENTLQNSSLIVTGLETDLGTIEISENNTVNGEKVKFYLNTENYIVKDSTFGELIFAYCRNITIENVKISTIELFNISNVKIARNVIGNSSSGVYVLNTENLNMSDNTIQNNLDLGVLISNSTDIDLSRNVIRNAYTGIMLASGSATGSNATLNATSTCMSKKILINDNKIYSTMTGIYGIMLNNLNITNNKIYENEYINLVIYTSSNVLVANNTIKNSTGAGIQMTAVNHAEIYNNTIKFNGWAGIHLDLSERCIVRDNLVEQNYYGIYLYMCSNVLVFLNNFSYNTNQAYDDNNNSFDNGTIGNYWSDYTGTDTNGDGIGDTPYNIFPNAKDNYPLVSGKTAVTTDTIPPTILSVVRNVTQPREDNTVLISVNVTDNTMVSQVILSYRIETNGSDSWVNKTMIFNTVSGLYEATIPPQPANTIVQYKIYVKDSSDNWVVSPVYNYTVSSQTEGTSGNFFGNIPLDITTTIVAGLAIGATGVILF
ncbi:MAG: right-handed parallel beta-helix repeat-containing protein, partial [Candidatus Odinarchaeota archaeon]|nr:right-handed parallel beta-helix repeat-containing protein [Candidatus Odinarchaeota archaeon]